jgi:hypothetical protein
MVEKTVKICDFCKERVTENTCSYCDRDYCDECSGERPILGVKFGKEKFHNMERICQNCGETISEAEFPSMPEQLEKDIIEFVKKVIIAESISKPKRKKSEMSSVFNSSLLSNPNLFKNPPYKKLYKKLVTPYKLTTNKV